MIGNYNRKSSLFPWKRGFALDGVVRLAISQNFLQSSFRGVSGLVLPSLFNVILQISVI